MDVAVSEAGERLVAACVEAFGGVDVLVNNAGIYPMVPMLETSPELWDRVQAIHLRGLVFVSQAVWKRFVEQGGDGSSSTSGRSTRCTPRGSGSPRTTRPRAAWRCSRMGEPDDIATAPVFLASPASAYMTGELVVVDGGALLT